MPVGYGFGPKPGAIRRRPPDTPPPTGEIRWISPTGTGTGASVSSPAALSTLNTQIAAAGPGGQVRIRGDQGDYTGAPGIAISAGGTSGFPVVIYGSDGSGNPVKAVIRGSRTNPWPTNAVGASAGGTFITLNSGANFLNFRGLHLRDMKYAFAVRGQITGLTFGDPAYRDTAVAALIPSNAFIDPDDPAYFTTVANIYSASAAGVSATIQARAVDMTNCYRGLDVGTSAATTDTLNDFRVYGGTYRGTARGWYRLRGGGQGVWFQDTDMDGGGLTYWSEDGNWAVGVELNDNDNAGVGGAVFLRCIANNHRCTDRTLGYTNGDGFSGERLNDRCVYIRCQADGNEDGGIETKATNVCIIGGKFEGNRRNFRLWGTAECHNVDLRNPTTAGRTGGGTAQIYSENAAGLVRLNSGSVTSNDTGYTFQGNGNFAFIAVSSTVSITRNPGSTLYSNAANLGFVGSFNPADTSSPVISSSGTRSVSEGAADNYTPTVNVPFQIMAIGGPDAARISSSQRTASLGAQFRSAPADADLDNVYTYTVQVMGPNRKRTTQTVNVTVGVATPVVVDVVARMGTAGSAPNAARATILNAFVDVLEDQGVGLKTQNLVIGKAHSSIAGNIGWIGSGLSQDNARVMPTHTVDMGHSVPSTAEWCYWGGANNAFAKISDTNTAIACYVSAVPPRIDNAVRRGDVFGWDNTYISCNSDGTAFVQVLGGGELTITGAFPGFLYAERKGTTVNVYKGTTLATSATSTGTGRTGTRPRYCARDGGNAPMTGTVSMAWVGTPLSVAELTAFSNGIGTMFTAIGGAVVNPPPQTPQPDPLVAILGASRFRQGYQSHELGDIETTAAGQFEWARAIGANFRVVTFSSDTNVNSFGMAGLVFARDGDGFAQFRERIPAVLASDADVVIINAATGGIQFGTTVQSYCDEFKALILQIYGQKAVVIDQLWERGSNAGGPWGVGQLPRALIPGINAEMASWCSARSIPVLPARDVLIDLTGAYTPNFEPLPGMTRGETSTTTLSGDTTHLSNLGGYTYGKAAAAVLSAAFPPPSPVGAADAAGNFVTNPLMTGTGGSKTNVSGDVADSYAASRNGTTVTITAAKVSSVPLNNRFGTASKTWQQFTISNTSALTGQTREGVALSTTVSGLTVGNWYEPRFKVESGASLSAGGVMASVTSGANRCSIMAMLDNGGGTGNGFWSTRVQAPQTEQWAGMFVGQPFKAAATTATFVTSVAAIASAQSYVVRLADYELRAIPDPMLLTYDEDGPAGDVTFTTGTTFTTPEDAAFSTQISTSEPCTFTLDGADAARFAISAAGVLTGGPFDHALPTDANADNVYVVVIVATPVNTAKSQVTQNITITVEAVADGFTDTFTGTTGTDIAANNALWTRVSGVEGTIYIDGNTARNSLALTGANGAAFYLAPNSGSRNNRTTWTMLTNSQKAFIIPLYQDSANYLRVSAFGVSSFLISKIVAGVNTPVTCPLYKNHSSGDVYDAIVDGDTYRLYQNQVKIGEMDITGLFPGSTRVGLVSNGSSGSGNTLDNFSTRAYTGGYVERVALNALTMSPLTGLASADYVGALSGRTVNSTITLGTVTVSAGGTLGTWIPDGDFIRGNGLSAGATYTVPVIETFGNAANSPRTTTFNVAIS
jgi:hypothetical protein